MGAHPCARRCRHDQVSAVGCGQVAVADAQPQPRQQHQDREIGRVLLIGHGGSLMRFLLSGLAGIVLCTAISAWVALYLARRQLRAIIGPLHSLAAVAHAARSERALDRRVPPTQIAAVPEEPTSAEPPAPIPVASPAADEVPLQVPAEQVLRTPAEAPTGQAGREEITEPVGQSDAEREAQQGGEGATR